MESSERGKSPDRAIALYGKEVLKAYERAMREADNSRDVEEVLKKMEAFLKEAGGELTQEVKDRIREILRTHGF